MDIASLFIIRIYRITKKTQFFQSQKLSNYTILLINYYTHILFITR